MLLTFLIIIASISLLLIIFIITASNRTGVVPMPSLPSERRLVSDIISSYPNINGITDLGSGWGGMARHLTDKLPGRIVTAVESSIVPHCFSILYCIIMRYKSISCSRMDLLEMKLNNNEAYITYLSGPLMKKLRASFECYQPTGGLLISIAFAMPGWTPSRVEHAEGMIRTAIYIYEL